MASISFVPAGNTFFRWPDFVHFIDMGALVTSELVGMSVGGVAISSGSSCSFGWGPGFVDPGVPRSAETLLSGCVFAGHFCFALFALGLLGTLLDCIPWMSESMDYRQILALGMVAPLGGVSPRLARRKSSMLRWSSPGP